MQVIANGRILGTIPTQESITREAALEQLGYHQVCDPCEGPDYEDACGHAVYSEHVELRY